jgi:thiamine pyrophosphate-dependent acetolactate synthase large subunit-like protein
MTMSQRQALEVLLPHRQDAVVITTMTSAGIWPQLSNSPLDFAYIPSAMGHAPDLGLGLALAQPGRRVIVVNGDGCMLMNLGVLVTLAQYAVPLYLIILDNGLYEVTGGQMPAGAGRTDFAQLAHGAGIARTYCFDNLESWQSAAGEVLHGPGPVVAWLKVEGRLGQKTPKPPRPMAEQIARLREGLGVSELPA